MTLSRVKSLFLLALLVPAFHLPACLAAEVKPSPANQPGVAPSELPLQNWIDGHVLSASFVLYYGKNPEPVLELVTPSGKVIRQRSMGGPHEVSYHNEPKLGTKFLSVTKPEPGKWLALINGKPRLPNDSYDVSYSMDVENDLKTDVKLLYLPGKGVEFVVTAALEDPKITVTNLAITSYYFTEEGEDTNHTLAFHKAGPANDWHASNAIFTSDPWRPAKFGHYSIVVVMKGLMEGHPFLRQDAQKIPYYGKPWPGLKLEPGKSYKVTTGKGSVGHLYNIQVLSISNDGKILAEEYGGYLGNRRTRDVISMTDMFFMQAQFEPIPNAAEGSGSKTKTKTRPPK